MMEGMPQRIESMPLADLLEEEVYRLMVNGEYAKYHFLPQHIKVLAEDWGRVIEYVCDNGDMKPPKEVLDFFKIKLVIKFMNVIFMVR